MLQPETNQNQKQYASTSLIPPISAPFKSQFQNDNNETNKRNLKVKYKKVYHQQRGGGDRNDGGRGSFATVMMDGDGGCSRREPGDDKSSEL